LNSCTSTLPSVTVIESSRFGRLEIAPEDVLEFPRGLIGLGGSQYTLLDRNPGSGFCWLHCIDYPDLALPVVDPRRFFRNFALALAEEERERIGVLDLDAAAQYVTVRTAPDPADVVVNLRAPIVVWEGRGHQVLNTAPGAVLQAHLFAPADPAPAGSPGEGVAGESTAGEGSPREGGPVSPAADAA
jgi:flagellar assembly factor FliW